jgi:hypothetical protein
MISALEAAMRLEGFEPPTNGLEGRRSSSELQALDRRVARGAGLLHELGPSLGVSGVPGAQVELHPHAVVPDRREPVDLDRVRPDFVGDVLAPSQERDQAGKVGRFLNSNPQ